MKRKQLTVDLFTASGVLRCDLTQVEGELDIVICLGIMRSSFRSCPIRKSTASRENAPEHLAHGITVFPSSNLPYVWMQPECGYAPISDIWQTRRAFWVTEPLEPRVLNSGF